MFLGKLVKRFKTIKLSIKSKLILSLLSIAAILLVSSTISVLEYRSMSNYVSELIADDISSINVANRLSDMTNLYNLQILEAIGEEGADKLPDFDEDYFTSHCDSLRMSSSTNKIYPMADSVMYSYAAFMLTSREIEHVEAFSFLDTRDWYFNRLQPRFNRLTSDIDGRHLQGFGEELGDFRERFLQKYHPGDCGCGSGASARADASVLCPCILCESALSHA